MDWSLDDFGRRSMNSEEIEGARLGISNVRDISCGAYFTMLEVSSCSAIAHQLVRDGSAEMVSDLLNILGSEAVCLLDKNRNTLLHSVTFNVDCAAVLRALLDSRLNWNLNAKNTFGETPAELYVSHQVVEALEIIAERGARLETALIVAAKNRNTRIEDVLLEYRVDRAFVFEQLLTEFIACNNDINLCNTRNKLARTGGLLGLKIAKNIGLQDQTCEILSKLESTRD